MAVSKKSSSTNSGPPRREVALTGLERQLGPQDIIVSKTDPTGRIVYANKLFIELSGFDEESLIGAQQSIVRHPDMPRCLFKLVWQRLQAREELFAYVVNRCRNGDHYWVFAHVTPSLGTNGDLIGFHSTRRRARPEALAVIKPLYSDLCRIEATGSDRKVAMEQSSAAMEKYFQDRSTDYDRFIFGI